VPPLFPIKENPPGEIERVFNSQGRERLLGVDEAGRGALFGPVVAAAVMLDAGAELPGLDDSKELSPETRAELAPIIRKLALAWGVGEASNEEIDKVNILQATFLAMNRAIDNAMASGATPPDLVLVDGPHPIAGLALPQKPIVKGDRRSLNIAAASVLAKTHRDRLVVDAAAVYPGYGLEQHKGYATQQHRDAIARLGLTPLHRRSFRAG